VRYEDNDEDLGLDASAIRALDPGDSGGDGGGGALTSGCAMEPRRSS